MTTECHCLGGTRRELTVDDRLRADLFAIWQRGFHGEPWDDSWVQDFVADFTAALGLIEEGHET